MCVCILFIFIFCSILNDFGVDDYRFYIALISALEQTHCAFVACDSK